MIVGLGLVGASFGLVVAQYNQLAQLPQVLAMTLLALAGIAVVIAPWLHRSRAALNEARAEKVRADARADMAAHLHDSVLQTLAMIQKQSEDPRAVAQLARRQERELRGWLYADDVPEASLKAALTAAAAEVEDERACPSSSWSSRLRHLRRRAGAREGRARGHGQRRQALRRRQDRRLRGGHRDPRRGLRPRPGAGFDLDAVADDRHGVRGSILNRMARHGGRASVRSQPGDGTEVRLEVTR